MPYPSVGWIVWGNNDAPVDATLAAAPDASAQDRNTFGLPPAEAGDWTKLITITKDALERICLGDPGRVANDAAIQIREQAFFQNRLPS